MNFARKPYGTRDKWLVGPKENIHSGIVVEGTREDAWQHARKLTKETGKTHKSQWAGHT